MSVSERVQHDRKMSSVFPVTKMWLSNALLCLKTLKLWYCIKYMVGATKLLQSFVNTSSHRALGRDSNL